MSGRSLPRSRGWAAWPGLRWPGGGWVLTLLFVLLLPLSTPRIYAVDEVGYFVYLRSVYFDGDLDFRNEYEYLATQNPRAGLREGLLTPARLNPETGLYGNVAPVGSAIMWAPAFILADLAVRLANLFGAAIPADGYSWPYIRAVCYAAAVYSLLGVLLSYRLARQYVSDMAATLAAASFWLASPLVFYTFVLMPWSHGTALFLVALFITLWHTTRERRSLLHWAGLGLLGGLMTMVREQLGLVLLIPAVEALGQYLLLLNRLRRGGAHARSAAWRQLGGLLAGHLLFLLIVLASFSPQLLTYQILNGAMRPSAEVGGKFDWRSPCFVQTLIDITECRGNGGGLQRGALLWNPILLLGLAGLPLLWRRDRGLTIALALLFVGQTYMNGALLTWHLTGSFGFRRLIEVAPLFILGLALLIERFTAKPAPRWHWWPLGLLAVLLVGWNAALALNWALWHAEELRRSGLIWPDLFVWQLEAPQRLLSVINDLLFNRCRFVENGGC